MLYWKAIHIIFVVTWFAGLFYIVRLFIYDVEASEKAEPEKSILQKQFRIMQRRLWFGITWPSAVLAISSGLYLGFIMGYLSSFWLMLKIGFVIGLFVYHLICHRIFNQIKQNICSWTSTQLRLWNEVATLFLVSIVFIVVLKNTMGLLYGMIGLVIFTLLLLMSIKIYKSLRK